MTNPSRHDRVDQSPQDTRRVTAWYPSPDAVRHVELELERHGVDPVHISLPHDGAVAGEERRRADERTARWAFGRTAVGTGVGALAGAMVFALVGAVLADTAGAVALFALGGAVFGATVGFFYGFAVGLPAGPEAFDTFSEPAGREPSDRGPSYVGSGGGHWITVEAKPETVQRAAAVMRDQQPDRVATS